MDDEPVVLVDDPEGTVDDLAGAEDDLEDVGSEPEASAGVLDDHDLGNEAELENVVDHDLPYALEIHELEVV